MVLLSVVVTFPGTWSDEMKDHSSQMYMDKVAEFRKAVRKYSLIMM